MFSLPIYYQIMCTLSIFFVSKMSENCLCYKKALRLSYRKASLYSKQIYIYELLSPLESCPFYMDWNLAFLEPSWLTFLNSNKIYMFSLARVYSAFSSFCSLPFPLDWLYCIITELLCQQFFNFFSLRYQHHKQFRSIVSFPYLWLHDTTHKTICKHFFIKNALFWP